MLSIFNTSFAMNCDTVKEKPNCFKMKLHDHYLLCIEYLRTGIAIQEHKLNVCLLTI